jgi:hypothetical protein
MRYLLNLQEYNFAIYYRKGTENCDADAVSRLKRTSDKPVYWTEDELSRENGVVSKNMLERARALDRRNEKLEKTAKKILNKVAKTDLQVFQRQFGLHVRGHAARQRDGQGG